MTTADYIAKSEKDRWEMHDLLNFIKSKLQKNGKSNIRPKTS